MLACWVSPDTRTSVTVTKPSRGSLTRRSSICATTTWIRSATLRTRGLLMSLTLSDRRFGGSSHSGSAESAHPHTAGARMRRLGLDSAAGDLHHLEGLDDVALLDVLEVAQHQTTLEALADLGGVVLLTLERREVEVVGHDGAVADHPDLGVAADQAAGDHTTGDVADPGAAEDRTDLRLAQGPLLVLRLEHALERCLDLLDGLVDDGVVPDLHALLLGHLGRLALRADVEADDDRVGGGGQVDVGLGDRTDTAVDDAQRHLVADVDLGQGVLEGLHRTGDVALQDQVELLALALLHRGHEVFQAATHATQPGRLHGLDGE